MEAGPGHAMTYVDKSAPRGENNAEKLRIFGFSKRNLSKLIVLSTNPVHVCNRQFGFDSPEKELKRC